MSQTAMLQRCWEHDYRAPSFYMITSVTGPRRDCLGSLKAAEGGPATVALSPIGAVVRDVWRRTSAVYQGVEACEWVVMPDRFHNILWVKERLKRPMGHIVKAFKRVSVSPAEPAALQEELLDSVAQGTVLVSPCISSGEKAVARAALDARRPLIVLLANGFAPCYKPPGRYFDACADGRLLMLALFPCHRRRQARTRQQCLELNALARDICAHVHAAPNCAEQRPAA